jgi:hypothetical protein
MRGIGDRLHLVRGEVGLQPPALLAEHAAGGGDLDHVGAVLARLAHFLGAFDSTGAGIAAGKQLVDLRPETGDIAVPADDGQRRAGRDDAWARDQPLGRPAPERERGVLRASRLAHGGEPGERGQPRVLGPDDHAPLLGLDGFLPEIAARIAGQVDVEIDEAGDQRLARQVHHRRPRRAIDEPVLDADDPPVGDGHGRLPARRAGRVDHHRVGMDDHGFGKGRRGNECGGERKQ